MSKHFVITIGRQYGSGGRTVGKKLAQELGIHFYDEEILKLTSETSAIGEQYFRLADEKAGSNLLYRIMDGLKPDIGKPKLGENITSPENLFRFQAEMIRKLAKEESCIIAGRCANYILQQEGMEDLVRIFVYADAATRVKRVMDYDKVDEQEALRRMKRIDKERTEYHRYFTGEEWMDIGGYDLMINSSMISFDEVGVLMKDYLQMKGYLA